MLQSERPYGSVGWSHDLVDQVLMFARSNPCRFINTSIRLVKADSNTSVLLQRSSFFFFFFPFPLNGNVHANTGI
jgi:hypothetical protein